jgi:CheY-like chemotaxis protein
MSTAMKQNNHRILIIDDNRAIHEDFAKILGDSDAGIAHLTALEDALFGETSEAPEMEHFDLCSAYQGRDGFEMVRSAENDGHPFAVAFVDMRMPPGWDGVETITQIRQVSQKVQAVICTAYSDYTWEEITARLGMSDRLTILRKPVDPAEVKRLVCALAEKWSRQQADVETAG